MLHLQRHIKNCISVLGDGAGGALYVSYGRKQELIDVEFVNNVATLEGGAISIKGFGYTEMSITNAVFSYNEAAGSMKNYDFGAYKLVIGGAICMYHGNLNLTSAVFSKNIAAASAYSSN